jgi:hypothetical protein
MYFIWYYSHKEISMKRQSVCILFASAVSAVCLVFGSCQNSSSGSEETPLTVPSGFTADASSDSVQLRWTEVAGADSYTVYRYDNTGKTFENIATTTTPSYLDEELTNDTVYYYTVSETCARGESGTCAYKSVRTMDGTCSDADWLILFYADGDNNLNDDLYMGMLQACRGLYDIKGDSSYGTVKFAALWDGASGKTQAGTFLGTSKSCLYEINPGDVSLSGTTLSGFSYTDYSGSASWLVNSDGEQEVDMASKDTLTAFLRWAQLRYPEAKKTVLYVSDHGMGPSDSSYIRRSLCVDETSGSEVYMSTPEFGEAIRNAGYDSANKLDLVLEDMCNNGSVEELYEVKDCVSYFVVMPSIANSIDVERVIKRCTSSCGVKELGIGVVNDYATQKDTMRGIVRPLTSKYWTEVEEGLREINPSFNTDVSLATSPAFDVRDADKKGNYIISSISLIDMSRIGTLEQKLGALASAVTAAEKDTDGNTCSAYIRDHFIKCDAAENDGYHAGIWYSGTFADMYDIGYLSYRIGQYAAKQKFTGVSAAAKDVEDAMASCIIAAWRDGKTNSMTYYNDGKNTLATAVPFNNNWFGLSVVASSHIRTSADPEKSAESPWVFHYPSWYTNITFGKDCPEWNTLIKSWWN